MKLGGEDVCCVRTIDPGAGEQSGAVDANAVRHVVFIDFRAGAAAEDHDPQTSGPMARF
jgi:hypothetical protein